MSGRDALVAGLEANRGLELPNRWRAMSALLVVGAASGGAALWPPV